MDSNFWTEWQTLGVLLSPPPSTPLEVLRTTFERFADAARAYLDSAASADAISGQAAAARVFSHFLRDQALDWTPPAWQTNSALGTWKRWVDIPALGLAREHAERAQRVADSATDLAAAARRLQGLWCDVLKEAADAFAAQLSARAAAPGATSVQALYDAWVDCAESAYARMAHAEPFCDALADWVNARSRWRAAAAETLEHWLKALDLPTRSEVDALHRRLKALETQAAAAPRDASAQRAAGPSRPAPRPRARRTTRAPKA